MEKRLFVIAGHGAGDCGAVGNGYEEAERVRVLAQKIKDFGGAKVVLADFAKNSYRSNLIGKREVPKECVILELHLDSSKNTKARGGHVIINANVKADKYDDALSKMIADMFPGRSKIISGRTDLANVRRAAETGYNYRLLECCFISNADDIKKFNANIDTLAKKILACFDIAVVENKKANNAVKSLDAIAKEVIAGKWGNGATRKQKLTAAGYDYKAVQSIVNKLLK